MDFLDFLAKGGSDFKGRTLKLIWSFSDDDIQKTHDFIQIIFPLNKASESVFHGYYLNSGDLVEHEYQRSYDALLNRTTTHSARDPVF